LKTSSRLIGYTPTAVIIALLVATPMGWRRRGWGLLGGLVAIHLFILFRLTLTLAVKGFGAPKPYALFDLSGFWMGVLEPLEEIFVHKPNVAMVVAVFLWLFVAFLAGGASVFRSRQVDAKPKRVKP
ncbi:MAG: hypothetical protein KJ749_05695, partial [Planctomycetes bacterium]|nr:hypothetical protein [Planctomycetota bacterium]